MPEHDDLTALLGSRICHDLISPLGAIGNGVELLAMAGGGAPDGPEMALIAESVANANARIRFFRVAFGLASTEQRMGRPEITGILSDSTRGGRLTVDWRVAGDLARREVRLAFLLIQCLESAMPWGGQIVVEREGLRWRLEATARRLKEEPALWAGLADPAALPDLTAAQVHFGLAAAELARQERRPALDIGPTRLVLEV